VKARQFVLEGDLELSSGVVLPGARMTCCAYGDLNAARDNAVLFPTRFGASHGENEFLIGTGKALDPDKYSILVPNLFGNGISSSPSNAPPPYDGPAFPRVTIHDAVRFQRQQFANVLGLTRFRLAVGWSMGAQQAYEWACQAPDAVERLVVICGAARTSEHNKVFLKSLQAAILADRRWKDGRYESEPVDGLRAAGRIYAGWAYSQDWYRAGLHLKMGTFPDLDAYLAGYWDALFEKRVAANLLAMINTWIAHDVSANDRYGGDLEHALAAIRARTLLVPCDHDLYFPTADNELELKSIRNGELVELKSVWGHMAASGQSEADNRFIDRLLTEHLRQ
jgi:homoserine O-acetyltransferase